MVYESNSDIHLEHLAALLSMLYDMPLILRHLYAWSLHSRSAIWSATFTVGIGGLQCVEKRTFSSVEISKINRISVSFLIKQVIGPLLDLWWKSSGVCYFLGCICEGCLGRNASGWRRRTICKYGYIGETSKEQNDLVDINQIRFLSKLPFQTLTLIPRVVSGKWN